MRPTFVIQKISNHGPSNPIVARLVVQSKDLIQWLNAPDDVRQKILKLYIDLHYRLLNCYEVQQRLLAAKDATIESAKAAWNESMESTPYVIGLEGEAENFLLSAKRYLRELVFLLNTLFDAQLPTEASIFWNPKGGESKLGEWAKKKFGTSHDTAQMFASEAEWVSEIVQKRNAVEHPGGKSGTLIVKNYQRLAEGFCPPLWARDGSNSTPPTDVYNDIQTAMDNLLTLTEDILIEASRNDPSFPQILFVEIPDEQRDTAVPVRIKAKVDLRNFNAKKIVSESKDS